MKKTIKIVVISIVIVGLMAMYVFSGFRFDAPAPAPDTLENAQYYPEPAGDESAPTAPNPPVEFKGPAPGFIPGVTGPSGPPGVQGPVSPQ